eukprot:COSAG01_NODE_794_length_13545_cov_7.323070_1_plen_1644_part_10
MPPLVDEVGGVEGNHEGGTGDETVGPAEQASTVPTSAGLEELFAAVDSDGSGEIDIDEFNQLISELDLPGVQPLTAEEWSGMDSDGSGTVDVDEFKLWYDRIVDSSATATQQLFKTIDVDGDGTLSAKEFYRLAKTLGIPMTNDQVHEAMREMDEDGSGEVDYHEFKAWYDNAKSQGTVAQWVMDQVHAVVNPALVSGLKRMTTGALFNKAKRIGVSAEKLDAARDDRDDADAKIVALILDRTVWNASVDVQRRYRGMRARKRVLRIVAFVGAFHAPGVSLIEILRLARVCQLPANRRQGPDYESALGHIDTSFRRLEVATGVPVFGKAAPMAPPPGKHREWQQQRERRKRLVHYLRLHTVRAHQQFRSGGLLSSNEDLLHIVVSGAVGRKAQSTRQRRGNQYVDEVRESEVVAGPAGQFGGLVMREDGTIARRGKDEPREWESLTCLTDCVVVTISWAHWLRVAGSLHKRALDAVRVPPSLRTSTDIHVIENCFSDVRVIQDLHFDTLKAQICRCAEHKRLHNAETLFKQGSEAAHFYIVLHGHVRIIKDGMAVAVLGTGDSFGEAGLAGATSRERKRNATVMGGSVPDIPGAPDHNNPNFKQSAFCDLAQIARADYLQLTMGTEKTICEVLEEFPERRTEDQLQLLMNLFGTSKFFKSLPSTLLQKQVCRLLRCQKTPAGKGQSSVVFKTGDAGNTFLLIIKGKIRGEVEVADVVFTLSAGDGFGDVAVTGKTEKERVRTATCTVVEDAIFATLSRADYLHVTGELERQAMVALRKQPHMRSQLDKQTVLRYLNELEFFKELHFPLLQLAVCQKLLLRELNDGDTLYSQGAESLGRIFFLLRGQLAVTDCKADARTGRTAQLADKYTAVTTFCDTEHALMPYLPDHQIRPFRACMRTITGMAPAAGATKSAKTTIWVTGVDESTDAHELYDIFKPFGEIKLIEIRQLVDNDEDHGPFVWAQVKFAKETAVMSLDRADRPPILLPPKPVLSQAQLHARRDKQLRKMRSNSIKRAKAKVNTMNAFTQKDQTDKSGSSTAEDDNRITYRGRVTDVELTVLSDVLRFENERGGVNVDLLDSIVLSTFEHAGINTEEDVCVAELKRSEFLESKGLLAEAVRNLTLPPKERTVQQLSLVGDLLSGSGLFREMDRSASTMHNIQRNLCRFVVLQQVSAGKQICDPSKVGTKLYTVISGACVVDKHDSESIMLAGDSFGGEVMRSEGPQKYRYAVTAREESTLAVVSKEDFLRISKTEGIQRVIDQFWRLGLKYSRIEIEELPVQEESAALDAPPPDAPPPDAPAQNSASPLSLKQVAAVGSKLKKKKGKKKKDAKQRNSEETRRKKKPKLQEKAYRVPVDEVGEPVMTYEGYKQLYKRIAKVLATPDRFSAKELEETMDDDWIHDLETFGTRSTSEENLDGTEYLNHDQYSAAMYELINEWCGGVESTTLYEKMLLLMLERITEVSRKKRDRGELVVLPLKRVECSFQILMNLRFAHEKMAKQEQIEANKQKGKPIKAKQNIDLKKFINSKSVLGSMQFVPKEAAQGDEAMDQYLQEMFTSIDTDGSGSLDREELSQLSKKVGRDLGEAELDAAMLEMDTGSDGQVDVEEFVTWFKSTMDNDKMTRRIFDIADADGSGVIDRDELKIVL